MEFQALETIKQQWQFAADSMPQLVCLIDGEGRIIRCNRTIERWRLGSVKAVKGLQLHEILHPGCSDPNCYLPTFEAQSAAALAHQGRAECTVWDPQLKRHFVIRMQAPPSDNQSARERFFAVVSIDDVTPSETGEDESRRTGVSHERADREAEKRAHVEKVQARLAAILDKTRALVAMADRSGRLFYLNAAGRALLDVEDDNDVDQLTLNGCHAPRMRKRFTDELLPRAVRDGVWSGDSVLLTRDGREIKAYVTLIAYQDPDGTLSGFSLLGRSPRATRP